jgi:hypothetical protein
MAKMELTIKLKIEKIEVNGRYYTIWYKINDGELIEYNNDHVWSESEWLKTLKDGEALSIALEDFTEGDSVWKLIEK